MNKKRKIILAVLAGSNVIISIMIPLLVVGLYLRVFGLTGFKQYLLYAAALFSSLFRAIKVGVPKVLE